ncbi:MAG TPA: cyclic nucleotide-binding domain-containing protein [Thermoanaerobaculia bacterium]|nr:cyclic nucleotide-binding domain-containing protein [Thermoanaerobaculia bacterium]
MKTGPSTYKAGAVILEEGARDQVMFVIEDGSVEIFRTDGGVVRTIRVLGTGDFFGEMGLLDDQPRTASARAATDCTLLGLDAAGLDALLRAHPEVAVRMLRTMAARLREAGAEGRAPAAKKGARSPEKQKPAPAPAAPASALGALVTPEGGEIALPAKDEITLGRPDQVSGFRPDIDLGPLDTQRMTSRRHAKLVREDGGLFVLEEVGTANGTFVNGTRILPGVKTRVAGGDTLRFGGISLVYRAE